MPKTLEELASLISERDKISWEEAWAAVRDCAAEMEMAFLDGSLDEAEEILKDCLGLELDYLDLFIF